MDGEIIDTTTLQCSTSIALSQTHASIPGPRLKDQWRELSTWLTFDFPQQDSNFGVVDNLWPSHSLNPMPQIFLKVITMLTVLKIDGRRD